MEVSVEFLHLNIIVGTLLPVLVGALTKSAASRVVKTVVNALLSAVGGALVPILSSCADVSCTFDAKPIILSVGVTWVTSIATYYGFWDPTGADDAIHAKTAGFGIGGDS